MPKERLIGRMILVNEKEVKALQEENLFLREQNKKLKEENNKIQKRFDFLGSPKSIDLQNRIIFLRKKAFDLEKELTEHSVSNKDLPCLLAEFLVFMNIADKAYPKSFLEDCAREFLKNKKASK